MTNFDQFWAAYPGTKQNKTKCVEKYKKFSPEQHTQIMLAIDAQKRWRREAEKVRGEFVPKWRLPYTWLNQSGWEDENPWGSVAELKEKAKAMSCHCGQPMPCIEHFYPPDDKCQSVSSEARRQRFNELGIKKGPNGWKEPCLKYLYSINPRLANLLNRGTQ